MRHSIAFERNLQSKGASKKIENKKRKKRKKHSNFPAKKTQKTPKSTFHPSQIETQNSNPTKSF
jgi:hypothetical protein